MKSWVILLILFAVAIVVVLIVEFIGNKALDGMSNAARSRKIKKSKEQGTNESPTESLAARYKDVPVQRPNEK